MRSPLRWLKRQRELSKHSQRRSEIEQLFGESCGYPVKLIPAATKGGYDEIYYALKAENKFAVVRINSLFKKQNDPIGAQDPSIPLDQSGRLKLEWRAYQKLSPKGLSPLPLWQHHDAIACSWVDWQRASLYLTKHRNNFWQTAERIFPLVSQMHDCGVTHLDLNLGNILIDPKGKGAIVIDFEFGPVDWVNDAQQKAFDYLRLLDDCLKPRRGGKQLVADPARMIKLLDACVEPSCRNADVDFIFSKLKRIKTNPDVHTALKQIFINL